MGKDGSYHHEHVMHMVIELPVITRSDRVTITNLVLHAYKRKLMLQVDGGSSELTMIHVREEKVVKLGAQTAFKL